MANPKDYKHIAVWGQLMGSFTYYIIEQQEHAAEDNAPLDAVYRDTQNNWVRFADITNPDTIDYFKSRGIVQEIKP